MKYKNVFWGLFFILIGVLFVLKNLDIIEFTWRGFFQLWPIALVLWGIWLIPMKETFKMIGSVAILALGVLLLTQTSKEEWNIDWKINRHCNRMEDRFVSAGFNPNIKEAKFELDAAAGTFTIVGATDSDSLFTFDQRGNVGKYIFNIDNNSEIAHINARLEEESVHMSNKSKNNVVIKLNPNPVWDLNLDAGAAEVNFDFTGIKLRNLDLDGGASDIDLKLSNLLPLTEVNIEAGASALTLRIPKEAGCYIDNESVLSSKTFSGFTKDEDGNLSTENYATATNKIKIKLNAAVSDIEIIRY